MPARLRTQRRFGRRIPVAVAIGLVIAATLGVALTARHDNTQDVVIRIPAAHIGDKASYSATLRGDWLLDEQKENEAFPLLTVAWFPAERVRDETGVLRPAEVVRVQGMTYAPWNWVKNQDGDFQQGPAWLPNNHTLWFEPATSRLLAIGGDYGDSTSAPAQLAPSPLFTDSMGSRITYRLYPDAVHVSHCLAADDMQGRDLRIGDSIHLPTCPIDNLDHWRPAGIFTATAIEEVAGVQAMRLEGESVTMWWASGLPFPLRYRAAQEISIDFVNTEGGGVLDLELTGVTIGSEPRGTDGTVGPEPGPVATQPRLPWGMDETGIDHPFPLSEAYAEATKMSPLFSALLNRSHEAYVARASGEGWTFGSEKHHSWTMVLADGKEAVEVTLGKDTTGAGLLTYPIKWPDAGTSTSTTLHNEVAIDGTPYPIPGLVPPRWPTVAAVAERLRLYTSDATDALPVTHWAHAISCPGTPCESPSLYIELGHRSYDRNLVAADATNPASPITFYGGDAWVSHIAFNATGQRTMGAYESQSNRGEVLDLAAATEPPSSTAREPDSPGGGLLPFVPWSGPQAIGVSLLAVMIAATYWLWPAIKSGGALGLFSRLRPDRLLDHPQRARILSAVEASPGVHFSELSRRTGIPNGSLHHHLRLLLKAGRLDGRSGQGYTCYFPAGFGIARQRGAAASKADGAQRILAQVRATPGLSLLQVAKHCGLRPSTVSHHVQRLTAAGLLDAVRDGREVRLRARAAS